MVESTGNYFGDLGDTFVIVKNVPCIKCKQCGEVMYNGVVSERLEQIIDQLRESLQEVNVVNYTAA